MKDKVTIPHDLATDFADRFYNKFGSSKRISSRNPRFGCTIKFW